DRGGGAGEFFVHGGQFGASVADPGSVLGRGLGDGLLDQVVVVAVEAGEGIEDGLVEGVGVDARGIAGGGAVAGAAEAGVVAVGLASAVGGGADEGFAAFRAADAAGEVVVGGVGGAAGVVFPAGVHDGPSLFEDGRVDQGW